MSSEIIVNAGREETRVALLENGLVTEIYIDRKKGPRHRGQRVQGQGHEGPPRHAGGLRGHRPGKVGLPLRRRRLRQHVGIHAHDGRRGPGAGGRDQEEAFPLQPDRGPLAGRPGDPGPGLEGADQHQGCAGHDLHQHPRTLPRHDARREPHRRLAPHRERRGAEAPARDREPPPEAEYGLHHPDREPGQERGRLHRRHRVPREGCGRTSRKRRSAPRPRP